MWKWEEIKKILLLCKTAEVLPSGIERCKADKTRLTWSGRIILFKLFYWCEIKWEMKLRTISLVLLTKSLVSLNVTSSNKRKPCSVSIWLTGVSLPQNLGADSFSCQRDLILQENVPARSLWITAILTLWVLNNLCSFQNHCMLMFSTI